MLHHPLFFFTLSLFSGCSFSKFIESLSQIPEQLILSSRTNSSVATPTATPKSSTQSTPSHSPVKKVGPSLAAAQKVANSTSTTAGSAPNRARQQPQPVSKAQPNMTTSSSQKVVPANTTNVVQTLKTNVGKNTTAQLDGVTVFSNSQPPNGIEQSFQYAKLVTTAGRASNTTGLQSNAMSQRVGQSLMSMSGSTNAFIHMANHGGMPMYMYQQPIASIGTLPGQTVSSSYKEFGYTPSSIPGFNKAGTIQVTTVGLTMSSTPGAMYGSAMVTTSEIGGGGGIHSSGRKNYQVAPLPGMAINNGGQSMTYEVQALSTTPLTAVISPPARSTQQGVCVCVCVCVRVRVRVHVCVCVCVQDFI